MPDGIIISGAFFLAVALLYAATRPTAYRVERSITIHATPEKIFELICTLKNWELWSPWIRKDPDMKKTYTGKASGVGAVFEWHSQHAHIGKGRMELDEAVFPSLIKFSIYFFRPMRSWEKVEFKLVSSDHITDLTWAMTGRNRYIFKLLSMFFEVVDRLVGRDFEEGLAKIKEIAEQEASGDATPAPLKKDNETQSG